MTTEYWVESDAENEATTVYVGPRLVLRQLGEGLSFKLQVVAGRSFAGKTARIERFDARRSAWVRIRRALLRRGSVARFQLAGPAFETLQRIRALLPKHEVRPCYVAGVSNALTVQRPAH